VTCGCRRICKKKKMKNGKEEEQQAGERNNSSPAKMSQEPRGATPN
jgi:hypothetical protein